ncbi:MAG: 4Fe-4S binding protein [Kiritimatiellae bacterium]|nr:4Fe-4S binding protein [Kiritimatiellia bacterium]
MRRNIFRILSVLRLVLGLLVLLALTATFLDFTGTVAGKTPWLREIQFMPAVLAGSVVMLAILTLVTLLVGRVYCSVLCPLGVLQDLVRLVTFGRWRDRKFKAKPGGPVVSAIQGWTRLGFLFVFAAGGFLGLHFTWLDPYAVYGRFVSFCLTPLVKASRHADAVAAWADGAEGLFTRTLEVVMPATGFVLLAAGMVAFIAALAVWRGRAWCNTVCPVGTILGALAKFAWFRPRIVAQSCVSCRLCERICRAHCIHVDAKAIDHTKCVSCLDCSAVCPKGAITWKR